MNPFQFPPRQIPNPASAAYVLSRYDYEIEGSMAVIKQLQDVVDAIADVLKQKHPDLADDLELLIENAKYLGQAQGSRQDMDTLKSQFRAALPYAIRKSLESPTPEK